MEFFQFAAIGKAHPGNEERKLLSHIQVNKTVLGVAEGVSHWRKAPSLEHLDIVTWTPAVDGHARGGRLACIPICFAVATANRGKYQWANGGPGLARSLGIRHPAITDSEIAILACARTRYSRDASASGLLAPLTITQSYPERKKIDTQL